ncbi:hypothetical protein KBD08_01605 [Candidatus Babeliales bacterium]|nr:hypothetical protein [Candidatus Babeliales bacterium]
MLKNKNICFFLIFLFCKITYPHGFSENTLIQDANGSDWQISSVIPYIENGQNLKITSYDEYSNTFVTKKIQSAGISETDYYCIVTFPNNSNPIICTPLQLFYRPQDSVWVAAYKLNAGDRLLCGNHTTIEVNDVEIVHEKLNVYTLEIKKTHTFLVGRQQIVAHNMLIPIGAVAGLTIPVDIGCGASFGSMFGPVGVCAGVVVGGLVGCAVNACFKDKVAQYNFCFKPQEIMAFTQSNNKEIEDQQNDAQAPGKPTEKDGFIPKKNWDGKKVRHPKTGVVGWPDEKGNAWTATGKGSLAHGGPHWDVTSKNGKRHWNVMPQKQ